jgi:hypothetical protein
MAVIAPQCDWCPKKMGSENTIVELEKMGQQSSGIFPSHLIMTIVEEESQVQTITGK